MATIIKREQSQVTSGDALRGAAYNLTDMASHADDYLETVRREANKIVAAAEAEAAALRQQATVEGRRTAEAAVDELVNKKVAGQMASLLPALELVVQQFEDAKQQWMRHWEAAAVQLSTAIAEKIIRRELAESPDIAVQWLRDGLQMAAGASEIVIRLHPQDLENLGSQAEVLAASFRSVGAAQIIADETITPGGSRVETEFGSVDQQLETQLQRIAEELS